MGLIVDTDVWVLIEKGLIELDWSRWANYGGAFISVISASELLAGVERANTPLRQAKRSAFVENLLTMIPILELSLPIARTHARIVSALPKNITAGARDSLIAATAIYHGHTVLTRNLGDFKIFKGLEIEPLN